MTFTANVTAANWPNSTSNFVFNETNFGANASLEKVGGENGKAVEDPDWKNPLWIPLFTLVFFVSILGNGMVLILIMSKMISIF